MNNTFAVWLTGIPASGKSTIAKRLRRRLLEYGFKIVILESDELRKLLTPYPKYTEEERDLFYRALAVIGKYLVENGIVVIFDATANRRGYREFAREIISNFIEVYLYCPLEICVKRDPKGLYKLAKEGKIKTLPGLQAPYEEPLKPDIKIDTHIYSIKESVDKILEAIVVRFRIRINRS